MTTLVPMEPSEIDVFLEKSAQAFATELAESGMQPDAALERARTSTTQARGDHRHAFCWVMGGHDRAGVVWFGPRLDDRSALHIWDIEIDTRFRGQGHGRAAILAVIDEARRRRVGSVTLNVFETNQNAKRLYERLGFVSETTAEGRTSMFFAL